MDFVVVGLGLGALGILCGLFMLGVLAAHRDRVASRIDSRDVAARDLAMAAEQREIGRAVLAAGAAVIVATTAALAASLDDRNGAFLVTSTVTVAAAGLLYWASVYRRRHPLPPRSRARSLSNSSARPGTAASLAHSSVESGHLPGPTVLGIDLEEPRQAQDDGAADAADVVALDSDFDTSPDRAERETEIDADVTVAPAAAWFAPTAPPSPQVDEPSVEADEDAAAVVVGTPARPAATRDSPAAEREPENDEHARS